MAGPPRAVRGGAGSPELSTPDLRLAALLDDLRPLVVLSQSLGTGPVVHVAPAVYLQIAELRCFDTARGNPLLVLGAELRPDESLRPGEIRVE